MNWNLITSIVTMYGILVLINVPAPLLGLKFGGDERRRLWFEPPGFVIPIIWFMLFTLLGIALHLIQISSLKNHTFRIIALAVLCASYAYYTLGLSKITGISPLWFGLAGNLVVIATAAIIALHLYKVLPTAAALVIPVAVWTIYATLIVVGEMRLQKLI